MFRKIILSLCLSLPHVTSAENLALTSKELIDLEFRENLNKNYSLEELTLILNEKLKEISVIFPEIQGVFVDEKNREIVLVTLKSEGDFIKLQQAKSILNAPVRLMVLSAPFLEHRTYALTDSKKY